MILELGGYVMQSSAELKLQAQEGIEQQVASRVTEVSETAKVGVMYTYGLLVLLSAFIFNTPAEILSGMGRILVDPSTLVSDYMEIGNIGAAFLNSGLLMIVSIYIIGKSKIKMNGIAIAAVFTVGGFALFGKNIMNVWAILLGVFLYSRYKRENFGKFIIAALFGTALGPLISQISFGFELNPVQAIIAGNVFGVIAGFIIAPLAAHFVTFHQGFNLYNIGFTAGMIGTMFMAIFRSFGLENVRKVVLLEGHNVSLGIYLTLMFTSMLVLGIIFNKNTFKGFSNLIKRTGRAPEDFIVQDGFGSTLINMALLGFIFTAYIIVVKGQLNGPTIGGILTIVGFGAYGKHVKNVIPILVGVLLASSLMTWEVNAIGPLLAALFGTTLAPIAGQFGWKAGILAGFLHMAIVMNIGGLHGGMNLYNNGFSGGMVAAMLVPVLENLKREK